uniref:Uncharacterized protein n=1 Tax=Klebsiella quasipneumoniae TaxID=1463165 RepID=A0A6M4NUA6_9ENTR|nr:hypothetical protein [Klebsiella quasipneumoniae]
MGTERLAVELRMLDTYYPQYPAFPHHLPFLNTLDRRDC